MEYKRGEKNMKLQKFKEKDNKRTGMIVFTIVCILLVSGVVLYRTFAIFEVRTNQNVIKGTVQDPGDIYFAFYVDNQIQKEMPKKEEGYMLDKGQSYCGVNGTKDPTITPSLDRDTWSIVVTGMTTSRTKCNLYFKKTYENTTLYDLSGNNYNGTFIGNVEVKKDEDLMGIYFDGVDDYIQVAELPETIDWINGFTIEIEFKALALDQWRRVYDFGNGRASDNILLVIGDHCGYVSSDTCMATGIYNGDINSSIYLNLEEKNQKVKTKIEYNKLKDKYLVRVYKNGNLMDNKLYEVTELTQNVTRTTNYLGKSNWPSEKYLFNGYIYSLKITDSNNKVILWYDF